VIALRTEARKSNWWKSWQTLNGVKQAVEAEAHILIAEIAENIPADCYRNQGVSSVSRMLRKAVTDAVELG
jgi:hypothetical protein